ncbi:MAG TPA: PKD domain-containing protein, partial [Planctomycetota bacterium]|nr:PKD domain-containing protein [Planctomycetota bacterium]
IVAIVAAASVTTWAVPATLQAQGQITELADDFERADGALDGDGWTVHSGLWAIQSGRGYAGPSTAEQHAYMGSPPIRFPSGDFDFSVDLEFLTVDGGPGVGRHAGVLLCMDQPAARSASSGYLVWWIDRGVDRGITLTRRDRGVLTLLAAGQGDPLAQPPQSLRISVVGDSIQVFADDIPVIDVIDSTYRGGYFGLWTWTDGQQVEFDNVELATFPPPIVACFEPSAEVGFVGEPVAFDASCSAAYEGDIASYQWDFGDGAVAEGAVVDHAYDFADTYTVSLTVETTLGEIDTVEQVISVTGSILPFEDDFSTPGAPESWTQLGGFWDVSLDGELVVQSSEEAHLWAGSPPGLIAGDITIDFDIEFRAAPPDGIGRHASIFFYAQDPISRWNTSAYSVWWIDRPSDFGMGLHAWGTGGANPREIQVSKNTAPDLLDPPSHWTITVEGPRIRCYGDGRLILDVEDESVPRSGYFGLFSYANNQNVAFDNVRVRSGVFPPAGDLVACARSSPPGAVAAGKTVTFDASCTSVPEGMEVASYRWDFGDGDSAEGEVVDHVYALADPYVVVLTVEVEGGESDSVELPITVFESLSLPYSESFDDLPPGPDVPGWTTSADNQWSITEDGALEVVTAGAEAHIWLGDPPVSIEGDITFEFSIEFLNHVPPQDGVGKHAGVFFYARDPISRWQNNAYDVWWIDRAEDFGLGIHEWSSAVTFLTPGTFELVADPPRRWRVEVEGSVIRVFGDDELLAEAEDERYRSGYLGFWAYANNQVVRFDDLCIVEGPFSGSPDCDAPSGTRFVRGDSDSNGDINLTDGIYVLSYLFSGGATPTCLEAADADGNSSINLTDGIYILQFLFSGGTEPPAPYPDCGPPSSGVGCETPPPGCA